MMRRLRVRAPLGLAAFGLALGSWMVSSAGAEDDAVDEAPAPNELPQQAFVTGPAASHTAQVDGIQVEAKSVDGGYELTLRNASSVDRTVRWEVDCSEVSGLAIGRMGPVARPVHHELVELTVPANGEAKHLVRAPHPEMPADLDGETRQLFFASMRIALRAASDDAPHGPAQQQAQAQAPALGVDARPALAMLVVSAVEG